MLMHHLRFPSAFAAAVLAFAQSAHAKPPNVTTHEVQCAEGSMVLTYLASPDHRLDDPAHVLVLFPPGQQTEEYERGMRQMFAEEATGRGWILVSPRPPAGKLFVTSAKDLMPPLLEDLDRTVRAAGGRYHVAGASNGGLSAFVFAWMYPERTASVIGFPGALPAKADERKLGPALKEAGVPIRLWVGEQDDFTWRATMDKAAAFGKKYELDIVTTSVNGQGHIIRTLGAKDIMDELDRLAAKAPAPVVIGKAEREVLDLLDQLHAAAAKADGSAYFALYAPEAVFIGTDAGERWTLEQFHAYTDPLFAKGKGWMYTPRASARNVSLVPPEKGGELSVAWFDELLDNEKYGTCRGTGVVRKVEGKWRVCQYHLTFPVPNDVAERVTTLIKTEEKRRKK